MKKIFYEYGQLNWLYVLFAINVTGFLVAYFAFMFSDGNSALLFAIHSGDKWSLIKAWKLISYSFMDHDVIAMIGNLIWLWIFGRPLADILGSKHILKMYVVVTLVVGVLAGVLCLFIPGDKYPIFLLGFGVVAVALAAACIYNIPHHALSFMLLGSIPMWVVCVVFLLFKIFTLPSKEMALTLLLSVVAAILGFVYMATISKSQYSFKNQQKGFSFGSLFKKKNKSRGKLVAISGNKGKLGSQDNSTNK